MLENTKCKLKNIPLTCAYAAINAFGSDKLATTCNAKHTTYPQADPSFKWCALKLGYLGLGLCLEGAMQPMVAPQQLVHCQEPQLLMSWRTCKGPNMNELMMNRAGETTASD